MPDGGAGAGDRGAGLLIVGRAFALALLAAAWLGSVGAGAPVAAPPAEGERVRIEALIRRALDSARVELARVRSTAGTDPYDRRTAEKQFARIVRRAEGCDSAVAAVRQSPAVTGQGIDLLIADSIRDGDRRCALLLAPLMLERWQDPDYTPAGQIALRFEAGALLDSAGKAEGRQAMREAEAKLIAGRFTESLWQARSDSLAAYSGGQGFQAYLEYLADRLAAEPDKPFDSTRNGLLALWAFHGRCDLVARVEGPGPESCKEAKALAKSLAEPSPAAREGAMLMARALGYEAFTIDERGLAAALESPGPWGRMTRLLGFVAECRRALKQPA